MDQLSLNPMFRIIKQDYPELLEIVERECLTLCLPDIRSIGEAKVTGRFLSRHILKASGQSLAGNLWVQRDTDKILLLEGPNYAPSYKHGLYFAKVLSTVIQTTAKFTQYKVQILDRPITPRACLRKKKTMGNRHTQPKKVNNRRKPLRRQNNMDLGLLLDGGSSSSEDNGPPMGMSDDEADDDLETVLTASTGLSTSSSNAGSSGKRNSCDLLDHHASMSSLKRPHRGMDLPQRIIITNDLGEVTELDDSYSFPEGGRTKAVDAGKVGRRSHLVRGDSVWYGGHLSQGGAGMSCGSPPPRQTSEDSGIEPDELGWTGEHDEDSEEEDDIGMEYDEEDPFNLPPSITSYGESEGFIMAQPTCDQFVTHLRRMVLPVREEMDAKEGNQCGQPMREERDVNDSEEDIGPNSIDSKECRGGEDSKEMTLPMLASKVQRLVQESVISFPKSLASSAKSPRYHDNLKTAVENVALQFLHDKLWPVLVTNNRHQDRCLYERLQEFYRRGGLHTSDLFRRHLRPSLCGFPLTAAVIELASLDQRITPLDRLTAVHEAIVQLQVHVRLALGQQRKNAVVSGTQWTANNQSFDSTDSSACMSYPELPTRDEEVIMMASVLIDAKPLHLYSSLAYIRHFAFSAPEEMLQSMDILCSAVSTVEALELPKISRRQMLAGMGGSAEDRLNTKPHRFRRELKLEDLIRIADGGQAGKTDCHGREVEEEDEEDAERRGSDGLTISICHYREVLARLEMCSKELTKHQEAVWTRLGRDSPHQHAEGPGPQDRNRREVWGADDSPPYTAAHYLSANCHQAEATKRVSVRRERLRDFLTLLHKKVLCSTDQSKQLSPE